jgi:alpha-glucosidase/alpha-D-xyloside xylohydrolase
MSHDRCVEIGANSRYPELLTRPVFRSARMIRIRPAALIAWLALLATSSSALIHAARADDTAPLSADVPDPAAEEGLSPPAGDPWYSPPQVRPGPGRASGLVFKDRITPHWFHNGTRFWYRNDLSGGTREFVLVDAKKGTRALAFDHEKLAAALSKAEGGKSYAADKLPFDAIAFDDGSKSVRFKLGETPWKCDLETYECSKVQPADPPSEPETAAASAPQRPQDRRGDGEPTGGPRDRRRSPDGKWVAFVKEHDVYLRAEIESELEAVRLTNDGKEGLSYGRLSWSPDSKVLLAFQIEPGDRKEVHLIQSSPPGGGRAKVRSRPYPLPGDKFDAFAPNLFLIAGKKQIKPEVDRVEYDVPRPRWDKDGRHFTYPKYDRGHQRFRLVEIDAYTGEARNIIDEKTDTFIWSAHTESLGFRAVNWLEESDEILYVSERDGCRHIYLVDAKKGEVKNRVTMGDYVVRGIDRIDEDKRQVWFRASGKNSGQDPYFIHYYRVNFDGTGLVALTGADGSHSVQFSPDRTYLIDTYGRVDKAPVHELRRSSDGSLVCKLEEADIKALKASGWEEPEVFVAKGRDDKTDIWGIICRPKDFDAKKRYPVIEQIYAGPQGSFVPKTFSPIRRFSALTDLGFIVVQMDGMGTANRSKAFHDVCWHNLKDAGFPDRILWHKAVAKRYPYYDLDRVGIYGTSAGGQNSTAGVLFYPDFYKVAVSACGCHDNRMDKASWNEQWMGYPVGPWYSESSNIDNAQKLRGKLLLIVGEMDTNVPPESTLRLVDALIRAGKDFDLVVVPNANHGMGGAYGQRRMHDFFVRHLLGAEPPNRNAPAARDSSVTRTGLEQTASEKSTATNRQADAGQRLRVAGRDVEVAVTAAGPATVRVSLAPLENDKVLPVPSDGSLVRQDGGAPILRVRSLDKPLTADCGEARVTVSADPLTFRIETRDGRLIQALRVDGQSGAVGFPLGDGLVLGLGEGGPQYDRRGSIDRMRNGQGGYRLRTHGGRVPVPWLIGTAGWAMFIHRPYGSFDLTGAEGRFTPGSASGPLPLDVFVVAAREPAKVMAEYARLTGFPEMPPLWALGYQQSHRTLAGREEVLAEARTFREKKLPCDALIYLGTGFCPSGWNTGHGSFRFNPSNFPDPKAMLDELHLLGFKVVPHVVIRARSLSGTVSDPPDPARQGEEDAASYWDAHRAVFSQGVDGWWPDEGDPLDPASRLARIRMYWEGPQLGRPGERPYALHRNGYAGMQRYGAFLWSGDVYSTWETLRTHVPIAVNTGLTGIPYWGADTGGFVPTKELTGELYIRWFQFSAFCPLFRSHGRTWKLRLPWGWNTGELGPNEIRTYGDAANPDPGELHNAAVEPICRKYLELRYRLMPYLYSVVREGHITGLPVMRALWLHYPDDPKAVRRGDEYLWGRDILVAPVTEKGASSRSLYLPRGSWYDFWTGERLEGGREIVRPVDLETLPLYVRAGAILPIGPLRQSTAEEPTGRLSLSIYPGADGVFTLYEDDGHSFKYRDGDWMGIEIAWADRERRLTMRLAPGSRMRPPLERRIEVRVAPEEAKRTVSFAGHAVEANW